MVGTIEQFVGSATMRKRKAPTLSPETAKLIEPAIDQLHADVLGKPVRIEIDFRRPPLTVREHIRILRAALELADYAITNSGDQPPWLVNAMARERIVQAIKKLPTRQGRARKNE